MVEAGFTDANGDGLLGGLPLTVSTNGLVSSGTDGYTLPADGDTNGVFDFQEAGTAPSISAQSANFTGPPGCDAMFSATTTNADGYQWQIFNGTDWIDLPDTAPYSGTTTNTLTITNANNTLDGTQYRVIVSNSAFSCTTTTSEEATLNIRVNTVITNRRITHRVNKN